MSINFNLESLLLPYGNRQIKVRAKANGYTDSELSNVIIYRSAPRIIFEPPYLHVYNLRESVTSIEVLYDGETVLTVPFTFDANNNHIAIDLSETEYPMGQPYYVSAKALGWESNKELLFENALAYMGVRRKAFDTAADGTVTHNTDPTWERTGRSVGKVANANKLASTPSTFTPAQDDFAMSIHGGELPVFKDIYIANIDHSTREEYKRLGESGFSWTSSAYDVMTCFPDMYFMRFMETIVNEDGSSETWENIRVSGSPFTGSFKVDKFRIATFHSYCGSSQHYSRAGVVPTRSTTISTYRTYARNMNNANNIKTKASVCDWHIFVIRALYLIKYATYNCRSAVGAGGLNYGSNNGGSSYTTLQGRDGYIGSSTSVWCLGLCDLWHNIYEMLDGIGLISGYKVVFSTDPDKYKDTPSATSDGFLQLGYTLLNFYGGWYPSFLDVDDTENDVRRLIGFGSTRDKNTQSSSLGVCSAQGTSSGNYMFIVGGQGNSDDSLFRSYYSAWSNYYNFYGCRLLEIYL